MEAIAEGVGNGLVQYGKKDCTYRYVMITEGINYSNIINFPQGVTLADVLVMRITQTVENGESAQLYKRGIGSALAFVQNNGAGRYYDGNPSDTFVYTPFSYRTGTGSGDIPQYSGSWSAFTDESITEILIIAMK